MFDVTLDGPKTFTPTFTLNRYPVTVIPTGSGTGTVTSTPAGIDCGATCTADFDFGVTVTLTATPAPGSTFLRWVGDCRGSGTCATVARPPINNTSGPPVQYAAFAAALTTLTVYSTGPSGLVVSYPDGISCGSACAATFGKGEWVQLCAEGDGDASHFEGWSGGDCAGRGCCTVTMDVDKSVTANFGPGPLPELRFPLDGDGTDTGVLTDHPMTFTGAVTFVPGVVGQAAQFASGGHGLVQGASQAFDEPGLDGHYTISVWLEVTSPTVSGAPFLDFLNRSTAPYYGGIQVGYSSDTEYFFCTATTTNPNPGGGCQTFPAPASAGWHNLIIRSDYEMGQASPVRIYEDGALVGMIAPDPPTEPIFTAGVPDVLSIGAPGVAIDNLRVYWKTWDDPAEQQCTVILDGEWAGSTCSAP